MSSSGEPAEVDKRQKLEGGMTLGKPSTTTYKHDDLVNPTGKLQSLIKSRRFWAAVFASLLLLFAERVGVDPEQARWVAGTAWAWIVGDSFHKTQ